MSLPNQFQPSEKSGSNNTWIWIAFGLGLLCSFGFIGIAGVVAYFWYGASPVPSPLAKGNERITAPWPNGTTNGDGSASEPDVNTPAKAEPATQLPTPNAPSVSNPPSATSPSVATTTTSKNSARPQLVYRWEPNTIYVWDFDIHVRSDASTRDYSGKASFSAQLEKGSPSSSKQASASGTGFVVHESGLIVTCAHVIDNAVGLKVRLGEKTYPAEIVATDLAHDLALLKISAAPLPSLALAPADGVELGQEVRSVGFPLKDVLGDSVKVTRGMLSGKLQIEGRDLFQIDASINPGNSGGPIVDSNGNVVGVASEKMYGQGISNIGFCIPSSVLSVFLAENSVQLDTKPKSTDADSSLARGVIPSVCLIEVDFGVKEHFDLLDHSELDAYADPFSRLSSLRRHLDHGSLDIATDGTILEMENALEAPSLLGPVIALPLIPLPRPWETSWGDESETELNLVVGDSFRDPLQGLFPRPFYRNRFGLQPEYEVKTIPAIYRDRLKITEQIDDMIFITRETTITSTAELKIEHRVEWSYEFDTKQALVVKAEGEGALKVDGKKLSTIDVEVRYRPAPGMASIPGGSPVMPTPNLQPPPKVEKPQNEMPEELKSALEVLANADTLPTDRVTQLNRLADMHWNAKFRQQVVEQIVEQLQQQEELILLAAIKALNKWDAATRIDDVLPLLKHTSGDIRVAAVEYFGAMQDGAVTSALCDALEHKELRPTIYAAMRNIGPTGEPGVIKMLSHPDESVRLEGCLILEEVGSAKSAAELKRLASGEGKDSQQAKKTMAKLGIKNAVDTPSGSGDDDINPFEPKKKPKA